MVLQKPSFHLDQRIALARARLFHYSSNFSQSAFENAGCEKGHDE
jgi:hypothetical protein